MMRCFLRGVLPGLLVLGSGGVLSLHAEQAPARIHVDAAHPVGLVNQKVFGQFIKGADNYGIFSAPYPDLSVLHEGNGIWNPDTRTPYPKVMEILRSYSPGALRYPDGLCVQNHDWKKTVGPLSERGDWRFGIPEFMTVCEAVDAEPVICVSEYVGTPQDAADLVEYLNMPATPDYPWALMRAADGHPEPYGVVWFEIGNESWVDKRKFGRTEPRSAEGTALHASNVAHAMKKVDSSVRCGVPMSRLQPLWDAQLLATITDDIDFVIIHSYPVKYGGPDLNGESEEMLLEAMLIAGYTSSYDLIGWRNKITSITGRDLPIAVTEYNVGPTQKQKNLDRPYRFSLAAALGNGDYLGRMMDPEQKIVTAMPWQWLNGFFGQVYTYAGKPLETREKRSSFVIKPMHYVSELWGRYRGDMLLPVQAAVPVREYPGYLSIDPCYGSEFSSSVRLSELNLVDSAKVTAKPKETSIPSVNDVGEWSIIFTNATGTAYPGLMNIPFDNLPAELRPPTPGLIYQISFESCWIPAEGSAVPNLGLGVMDSRGWEASGSAIAIQGLQDLGNWEEVTAEYQPLPETPGLTVLVRQHAGTAPVNGTLQIRNVRVEAWQSASYPSRPELSVYATRSEDKLYLMVFNLTLDQALPAQIEWSGFKASSASGSSLTGVSASAVNSGSSPVELSELDVLELVSSGALHHRFPAHSVTGIVLEKKEEHFLSKWAGWVKGLVKR